MGGEVIQLCQSDQKIGSKVLGKLLKDIWGKQCSLKRYLNRIRIT